MDLNSTTQQKQAHRLRVLQAIYEGTHGRTDKHLEQDSAERIAGLSAQDAEPALDYLAEKGLVDRLTFGGGSTLVGLTAAGVDEIEQAHSAPDKPTAHLPPLSVALTIGQISMVNSQFMAGAGHSSQSLTVAPAVDLVAMRDLVERLAAALRASQAPDDVRAELEAEIATVRAQVASPKPKRATLRESFTTMKTIVDALAAAGTLGAQWGPMLVPVIAELSR